MMYRSHSLAAFALAALALVGCASEEDAPVCEGTPQTCSFYLGEFACLDQAGCTPSGGFCGGVATACASLVTLQTCAVQDGCDWSSATQRCTGTPDPCSNEIEASCRFTQGCSWEPFRCTGVATVCEGFADQVACGDQDGCDWL